MHVNAGIDPYLRLRIGAALALLQPGIDPVFLVLLSSHSGLALADHGLVVGASPAGMAAAAVDRGGFPAVLAVPVVTLLMAVATLAIDRLRTGFAGLAASDALFHENATTDVRRALTET